MVDKVPTLTTQPGSFSKFEKPMLLLLKSRYKELGQAIKRGEEFEFEEDQDRERSKYESNKYAAVTDILLKCSEGSLRRIKDHEDYDEEEDDPIALWKIIEETHRPQERQVRIALGSERRKLKKIKQQQTESSEDYTARFEKQLEECLKLGGDMDDITVYDDYKDGLLPSKNKRALERFIDEEVSQFEEAKSIVLQCERNITYDQGGSNQMPDEKPFVGYNNQAQKPRYRGNHSHRSEGRQDFQRKPGRFEKSKSNRRQHHGNRDYKKRTNHGVGDHQQGDFKRIKIEDEEELIRFLKTHHPNIELKRGVAANYTGRHRQ